MSEWTPSETRPGYIEKSMQHGNCEITIFRPVFTDQERTTRERRVKDVLERCVSEYIKERQR